MRRWPPRSEFDCDATSLNMVHRSDTVLGTCWLNKVGHLRPQAHPDQLHRSYGGWFEQNQIYEKPSEPIIALKSSRNWPYGQGVTKIYQTGNHKERYRLDIRSVDRSVPYIPYSHGDPGMGGRPGRGDLRRPHSLPALKEVPPGRHMIKGEDIREVEKPIL
eukprot:gnl/MRDRNA2_/MRDRNA2_97637_c0_seq1.p1 gnl/MRDRNA2_/MRDRNA2_97637_c0~~gnl/MRDRNA2_/MRDRNA2_97637_c0_seq1.p1  ORF type:complete len:161 (+),score=17.36 gnl/MRDRNA2_/MRDRNA2_97637_c0_seq1:82-564(+)